MDKRFTFNEYVTNYDKWKSTNCKELFEDFECDDNSFDILYFATAFHWIPEAICLEQAELEDATLMKQL